MTKRTEHFLYGAVSFSFAAKRETAGWACTRWSATDIWWGVRCM